MCSGSYEEEMYNECEVGDLSGKEGALVVMEDGTAYGSPEHPDPLAALDVEFVAERGLNPPNKWSSILFHNGSPRVLCAKLYEGEKPPVDPPVDDNCELDFVFFNADTNEALGLLEASKPVCMEDFAFNIQARPTAACPTTLSAYMELTGEIHEARTENSGPYMIFGDRNQGTEILGKDLREGDYTITSQIFSKRRLDGDLVVEGTMEFTVVDCDDRRLRGQA